MKAEPVETIPGTLRGLTVNDAMRPGVITCLPADGVAKLAAIMVRYGIHATVLGPLSDVEALERAGDVGAEDIARDPVTTLPSDAALSRAVAKMTELFLEHVFATDPETGVPCGVISSFDIAALIGGYDPSRSRVIRPASALPSPLARSLRETIVADVMHTGIVTCTADAPLWTVGRSMAEHRVHCVAVAGVGASGGRSGHFNWGLIDDMELVRALHRGVLAEAAGASAVTGPIAVREGDSLELAAKLMIEDGARHVVVVGPSGLPSGMVSTLDVASILAGSAIEPSCSAGREVS
jgi:CBS domain-containing protein